ncbi:MAG: Low-specificity L-threonine aldolase [uncultured Thermomicrobiales bacterium]|uniref:Low-specificity L-threonine aldolase n=1 Tax=uncultured Thermomicrobiales bacterium TaxID=1645740 RepID=A0A6J4UJ69_9BACT|nr:MAG: Low-specificity L-threonine aldolase [uncultured Thermomicrobiales bacterium]
MAHDARPIDLRSDTVTRPTPAMRRAMAEAEVGDDQYGEDPTVHRLEARAAAMLGKEAALYVASGTMGNLVALLAHCGRGDEAILGDESHIFWYESGGAAALGGIAFNLRPTDRFGRLALDDIAGAIRPVRAGYPRTGVICLETTHNRCGGVALPVDYLRDVAEIARSRGVPVHLDGARIFNAAAALGVPAAEIAAQADSVQFCLSKGLAAPVGSVVTGTASFIEAARRARNLVGGAMRQAGVIAAAGLVALEEMVNRLPDDHVRARRLATGLAQIPGLVLDAATVQTNIVIFRPPSGLAPEAVIAGMKDDGVLISNYGTRGLRMVTHYEVDDAAIEATLAAAERVLAPVAV